MPAVSISPQPKLQFFDSAGNPLAGGKLYTYAAGTTTPLASYTDSTGNVANANPVVLDSRGEASVWLSNVQYKLALYTASNVLVWTVDGLNGPDQATLATLATSGGSALIGFLQAGTSAQPRTVQSKLRDVVSVKDFGAVGNGVADDTVAIQAALSASTSVVVPKGNYIVSGTLNMALNDATLFLDGGSQITHTATGTKCLNITGARNTVCGSGVIYSSGAQDATNSPITYAAIWVTGEGCNIRDITLQRITRCGVYFSDAGYATIDGITVDGEFNTSTWTPTDTVLFAIFADPNASSSQGQILVTSSKFSRLVSGIGVGNYSSANDGRGFSFASNLFIDCADHAVYCGATVKGVNVSANSCDRCGSGIALTGNGHVINGNTVTNFGAARGTFDKVSISLRDSSNCVVSNNTLIGPYGAAYSGIDFANLSSNTISNNVIEGNVVINTGTVQGRMLVVGDVLNTEVLIGNVINGNIFKGPGIDFGAVANLFTKATFYGSNNVISNNLIHSTNQWQCLQLIRQKNATITGNKFVWEYSAPSPATLDVVYLNDVSFSTVRNNSLSVIGGTNVTINGFTNFASGSNWFTENLSLLTDSSVAAAVPVSNAQVSDRVINNSWNINRVEASAAPTTGTWSLGDVVYNTNPSSGAYFGWVCTVAGTPGTWKTFGLIS
jgi:hypothetical protein